MEKHSFDYKAALVSGVFVLIGALTGSALTGYFAIRSQTLIAEQQKEMFAKQIAQSDRQELKSILTDYSEVLTDYYRMVASQKLTENEVDQLGKKAFKAAFQITLVVSLDLGKKTFELNQLLQTNLQAKHHSKYSPEMEGQVTNKAAEWVLLAKGEMKLLEYSATPDNLPADLIRLFLQGAAPPNSK
jgi:hypothetical protein